MLPAEKVLRSLVHILLFCLCAPLFAGTPVTTFIENKGQWPDQVLYRALIPGGALFVEREALTYVLRSADRDHGHYHSGETGHSVPKMHAWRVHFVHGKAKSGSGSKPLSHLQNFFLGNDPSQWGTDCGVFEEILLKDIWPGIDLEFSGRNGLKYDLIVAPGADPAQVKFRYEGQDGLRMVNGDLHVITTAGTVIEKAPVNFSVNGEERLEVESRYHLDGSELSFHLPENLDESLPLVIDPELAFGSFTGSTGDNFGFTATYDDEGHLYGGGIVFNVGYPTTVGVLDPSFNGGTTDVGISKWSPDGTDLIWSTYIGGTGNEAPHSLVVNSDHELFILGSTGSFDFPITPGCFDPDFNGGVPASFPLGSGFDFPNGADAFISHLNIGGSALIGSTFFGGTGSDGLNIGDGLFHNYGDQFRGEIALDANEDPVIATSTSSIDLLTSPGAPQSGYGGGQQDAFFLRMNAGLTSLLWGTYHGGSGHDSGYGIQLNSTGEIYVTGGTTSNDLPSAGSPFSGSNNGAVDGFIARYDPTGSTLLSTTYVGTPQYDQSFFVQLDTSDDVYVVGQTRGNFPITPGKYAVAGSSQFIQKFQPDLSASLWSTRIGNGNGDEDISPSAFLVSDCGQIYFSGWGGNTNNNATPDNSTTIGLPVTPDAFQPTTDGSDFYLMVLEPDADGLDYATFFGGGMSGEHVDGGTSRFDKNGKVYQAVCAGCGGLSDFPTTPAAWSETNNSFNCNLGVFKFDLSKVIAVISIDGPDSICAPATVQFESASSGGDTYNWTFGDGGQSTAEAPTHTFTEPGEYTVTLIVTDSYDCVIGDTASIVITALPPIEAAIEPIAPVCPGGEAQLNGLPDGAEYSWSPAAGLSATDIQDPIASPGSNTTYQLIVTGECGIDSATVDVIYAEPEGSALPDETICVGEAAQLGATGGTEYLWEPATGLNDPSIADPLASPADTTVYHVTITTIDGCEMVDSVRVNVVQGIPEPALSDTSICEGGSVQLVGPIADWYQWDPAPGLNQPTIVSPNVSPLANTTYVLHCGNVCGEITDTATVDVIVVTATAWPDTIVCPGEPIQLHALGAEQFSWSPATFLDDATSADPICTPSAETNYVITVSDENGCSDQAQLLVRVHPLPPVDAGEDRIIEFGDRVQLHGVANGSLEWEPVDLVDCEDCPDPWSRPEESTLYTLTVTDTNGCKNSDQVWVILNGSLFVPNTFTPNGDGVNDGFRAWGKDIEEFQLQIFDRWGEKIYESDDLDRLWDGTYKGVQSPIDTYVWRIDMEERTGKRHTLYGHVNLVR